MKKLLKIKEFFHLKKRQLADSESISNNKPAKRPRKALTATGALGAAAGLKQPPQSPRDDDDNDNWSQWRKRFLQLFEDPVAKDIVWWLPGRRGEAFAMQRERFEKEGLFEKMQFAGRSFSDFLEKLNRWGFRQMNIPSLSGRILTFERNAQGALGTDPLLKPVQQGLSNSPGSSHRNLPQQSPQRESGLRVPLANHGLQIPGDRQLGLEEWANLESLQMQQAHYLLQQEIAHTYFSLLWQELQRQLTTLLLHQTTHNSTAPAASTSPQHAADANHHNQEPSSSSSGNASRSTIAEVASLLHQQQIQQQVVVASFYRAALAEPTGTSDEPSVIRELNELHRQQMSNLTYQIVALVAANLEHQNHQPQELADSSATTHKVLVKYLIALVLLQLQQQQHNLEFLRQDRLTALALIRSLQRTPGVSVAAIGGASTSAGGTSTAVEPLLSSVHMQQLLAEAAVLSLSRAHQLLAEAAILVPLVVSPPPPLPVPPQQQQHQATLVGGGLPHHQHQSAHEHLLAEIRAFPSAAGLSHHHGTPFSGSASSHRTTTA